MALREILARFGIQVDDRKLKKADKSIDNTIGKLGNLGIAIGAGAIVKGFATMVTRVVDAGDALDKTSDRLGVSTQALQRWKVAADGAGITGQEFDIALKSLQKNATNAEKGEKGLKKAFDDLGVTLVDSKGKMKDGLTLMRETGLALNGLETDTEKVAISQKLMEESGFKLLSMFNQGEKGLDELLATLDKYGGVMSTKAVKQTVAAKGAFTGLSLAMSSLKGKLVLAVLPAITNLVDKLGLAFGAMSKFIGGTNIIIALLVAIGTGGGAAAAKFLRTWAPLLRTAGLAIAKFLILALIIDDIIALFSGGQSVLGVFIDRLFGAGAASSAVKKLGDIGKKVLEGDFVGALGLGVDALDAFGKTLVETFGPQVLDGMEIAGEAIWKFLNTIIQTLGIGGIIFLINWTRTVRDLFKAQIVEWTGIGDELGEALVDGIIFALTAGTSVAVENVTKMGKDLGAAFKKAIDSRSPSKLFERITDTVPQGVVKSLQRGEGDVSKAMQSLMASSMPTISGARVTQTNRINVTVPGSGNPRAVAQNVGRQVAGSSRNMLDEALAALVATG